jgi:histidinol-phosphatase (PHP family)
MPDGKIDLISLHGGHSGEFCSHAHDTLEEMVSAYIEQGFNRVGITEHMPPVSDRFIYPDEREAGLDREDLLQRFARYMVVARELQEKYASRMTIQVGFETETCSGSEEFIRRLIEEYRPDYIVGSVHHLDDIPFDYSPEEYQRAVRTAGSIDNLYCRYFDLQFEMINALRPAVVGHLDLIRIYDPGYRERMDNPEIRDRILRNLERIKELDLILDCNCRSIEKDGEPYPTRSILLQALKLGISIAPGDDSHSVATVGRGIKAGIELLRELGNTQIS